MRRTCLISGASRGIGLELCNQLLQRGDSVIACVRSPEKTLELQKLCEDFPKLCRLERVDVCSDRSVADLRERLEDVAEIHWLINNAGVLRGREAMLRDLSPDSLMLSYDTNVVGAVRMTQALVDKLEKGSKSCIANISSKVGSITDNHSGGVYEYRMSKTALNMFTKSLSKEFTQIICLSLHPGWVRTEMGGENALLSPEQSAKGMIRLLDSVDLSDSGSFYDYRGQEIPW